MDEEFFFPQNVRTSYRLWLFGPRQLLRLTGAPLLGLLVGLMFYRLSLAIAIGLGTMVAAAYTALCCIPITELEQTLLDVGLAVLRHRREQVRYLHRKEARQHGPGTLDQRS